MLIRLRKLVDYAQSPIEAIPWACAPFTKEDVWKAYRNKQFAVNHDYDNEDYVYNIRRIAYFIKRMPIDPIELDVGIPALGFYPNSVICDGWHRVYAAILRRDKYINASVTGQQSIINWLKY